MPALEMLRLLQQSRRFARLVRQRLAQDHCSSVALMHVRIDAAS